MLKNIKSVVSIILIALISSVKVLSDFIQVGASSDFFNAEYWQTTIRDNLLLVIVLFLASSVRKDKAKAKNAEYTELRKALSEAFLSLKSKKLIKRFEQYIDEDNLSAKLTAYKYLLNTKLDRIKARITALEIKYNSKLVAKGQAPIAEPNTEKLARLRLKKEGLEDKIENAEDCIMYVKRVRYIKVSYAEIFSEEEAKDRNTRDLRFHETAHKVFVLGKKALLMLVIGFLVTANVEEVIVNWTAYSALKICYDLFCIMLSVYLGILDGDKFVSGEMCDTLRRRINYLNGFIEKNKKEE